MEEILWWIEDSKIGMLVSSSQWGYPIVLSLHAVGMAVLVGVSLILAFRALGFGREIPVTALDPYWNVAVYGFILNLLSGAALFMGSASTLFYNTAFHIKLIGVVIGLMLTWWLVKVCVKGDGEISGAHRGIAAGSVVAWAVALIAGRLIGYFS
ncbi:hypothetical protein F7C95_09955 [Opitutia bacterium ISCC 51]|nr:hypothetical protein F7C95_09955 [Opitutae bacterium ISCC 51]QXD30239.1 hypothetical protein GA003_09895 [Opitutae bacterium ISCC 52]